MRVSSQWRRRTVRHELQRAVDELAGRAHRPGVTIWHVQPVIEICTAEHYPAWRKAREKTWRRERTQFNTRTWPQRLMPTELAGALLPQSHGGHYRGQPAEIATPVFSHSPPPPPAADFDSPYEPLVLRLTAGWVRLTRADPAAENAVLLAPPLVDLIGSRPRPRIAQTLGITWPLEPSQPHSTPHAGPANPGRLGPGHARRHFCNAPPNYKSETATRWLARPFQTSTRRSELVVLLLRPDC